MCKHIQTTKTNSTYRVRSYGNIHVQPNSSTVPTVATHSMTHTRALDSLNKLDNLINIGCKRQYLCDIGVAITVVSMGNDRDANPRNLLLKSLHSVSNVATHLQKCNVISNQ